jgi:hypothetical protein
MENTPPDEVLFDPTSRKLCPEGSCVGVIGNDGVCPVCGRTEAQASAGVEAQAASGVQNEDAGFDVNRRLCDDGACVGVIGDDGACRVCGRRAE